MQDEGRRRSSCGGLRLFRLALLVAAVTSLIAIGYFAALAVHWHDASLRLQQGSPMITFHGNSIEELVAPPLPSSPKSVDDLLRIQERVVDGIEVSSPATVAISILDERSRFQSGLAGSGVVVTEDGFVLTAGHVSVEAGKTASITFPDGKVVKGETLGMSMISDTGMIKITDEGKYPFVPLAKSGDIEIGQWCYALGYPGGYQEDRGAVARVGRLIGTSLSTIRTDCKLLRGDSGGPLFNLNGELIGIHSRISDSPDENYHAPISAFHRGWQDLKEKQVIQFWDEQQGGYLGVTDCAPLEDDAGLLIRKIESSSPAYESGMRVGDIITHIDGFKIIDRLEYSAAVESKSSGEILNLRYRRGARSVQIKVELREKPERIR